MNPIHGKNLQNRVSSPDQIAETLECFIRKEFQVPDNDLAFTRDAHLYDLGLVDSTGATTLIAFIESTYGITLRDTDLFSQDFTTINGISGIIYGCLASEANAHHGPDGEATPGQHRQVGVLNAPGILSRGFESVRSFKQEDIPQVADLHRRVFLKNKVPTPELQEAYRVYFTRVFLNRAHDRDSFPSLVYQDDRGKIVGFKGVMPIRLWWKGRLFQGVVSSQFAVDPESRSKLVAFKLLKALLNGSRDFIIADEANDIARRVWEGTGGTTVLLYSLHWTRPLRPFQYAVSVLKNRNGLAAYINPFKPAARMLDAFATKNQYSYFHLSKPQTIGEELNTEKILYYLPGLIGQSRLQPSYDEASLSWILSRAEEKTKGFLQKVLVKGENGGTLGWYIYYLEPTGIAQVLQVAAKEQGIESVLDHLFYEAWQAGALALTGRLEPRFLQTFSDKYCLLHRRGPWTLVHSKDPDLLQSFHSGEAFFSRLDGEWCLRFR